MSRPQGRDTACLPFTTELAALLEIRDDRLAPMELGPVAAVQDMIALLVNRYRADSSAGRATWKSASTDMLEALSLLGPSVRSALQPLVAPARNAVRGLPRDLAGRRSAALDALRALQDGWVAPGAVRAAWDDLTEACSTPDTSDTTVAVRRDVLYALISAAKRSPSRTLDLVRNVLRDRGYAIHEVRAQLGDTQSDLIDDSYFGDGGLSDSDRLDLCGRFLGASPRHGPHVVWIGILDVAQQIPVQNQAAIRFYRSSFVQMYRGEGLLADLRAPELTSPPDSTVDWVFGDTDLMLARVDLGQGTFPDVVAEASRRCRAVLNTIGMRGHTRQWRLSDGFIHAIDGVIAGTAQFHAPPSPPVPNWPSNPDPELTQRVIQVVAESTSELDNVLQDLENWYQAADRPDPAQSIKDYVALIERQAARLGLGYYAYIKKHLAETWVYQSAVTTLRSVMPQASRVRLSPGCCNRHQHEPLTSEIIVELGRLAKDHTTPPVLGRRLRSLTREFTTPESTVAWAKRQRATFDRAVLRMKRVRDIATHAGSSAQETAVALLDVARYLSGTAIELNLRGLTDARGVEAAHARHAQRAIRWQDSLRSVSTIRDVSW